jgi:hypothetical protein
MPGSDGAGKAALDPWWLGVRATLTAIGISRLLANGDWQKKCSSARRIHFMTVFDIFY